MNNEIMVSVFCTVYNHEKFLRKCLDGLVNQKTDFKFEILIHDDCSTDNSKQIIKEYEQLYPDLFIAIYSDENQYSRGVEILQDILLPRSHGKYIAFCEGDDYWIREDKLQLQYNYMETHPECSLCTHNTIFHDLNGEEKDRLFNNWTEIHQLSAEDIFWGWTIHTSSHFIRRECYAYPAEMNYRHWFGDYVMRTYSYSCGSVVSLPEVMSVYNSNNTSGVSYLFFHDAPVEQINTKILERAAYLKEFNVFTNRRFEKVINYKINEIEFKALFSANNQIIKTTDSKREAVNAAKSIRHHSYFHDYLSTCSLGKRLKTYYKYMGYYIYPVWKYTWNKLYK